MAQQPTFYNDGTWTTGIQVGANIVKYPFDNYSAPDVYARNTYLSWRILPANFAPLMATRTSYTNLILQSEALTTTWAATNLTVTSAGRANPFDGQVTMFKCLETVTNAEHYNNQAYAFSAGVYTFSFFVAGGLGRDYQYLKVNDGTSDHTCFFNTTDGTVGTASGAVGSIQAQTDGSYRISIVATCAAGTGFVRVQSASDSSTVSYVGDITKGFYAWGAQVQLAAAVGPYIPTTSIARTISSPDWQAAVDPFAYLVWESDFTVDQIQRASFQRMYARIPKDQTSYPGSKYIPLPSVTNTYGAASSIATYSYSPYQSVGVGYYDTAAGAIYAEFSNALYGTAKAPSARSAGFATAGTFTLSYGASTTAALNWNDAGATIAAAINGLASVIANGLTSSVTNFLNTGTGGSILIQWTVGSTLTPVLMNAASLTVSTSKNPATEVNDSVTQDILLPDHFTISVHGFSGSVPLAVVLELLSTGAISIVLNAVGEWGVIDANTIWFPTVGLTSSLLFAAPFKMSLGAGQTVLTRTKVVESFYLPGVSSGITTPADIPTPSDLQQASAFVYALLNSTGYQTYQSEGPSPWMDSLIYSIKRVEINLDDL